MELKVFLALRRVDKRPDADSILEGDLIAALERQGLTCIGRCRDFESQTFDNLPGAMHLSSVAGGQFAWSRKGAAAPTRDRENVPSCRGDLRRSTRIQSGCRYPHRSAVRTQHP